MSGPMKMVQVSAFDAARLKALDRYAYLEHSLAALLSALTGATRQAYTIFYRISNTRSRYAIIDSLIRDAGEPDARKFWQSIEKKLVKIDGQRNNIVHWTPIVDMGIVGGFNNLKTPTQKYLRPGHSLRSNTDNRLTIEDLESFIADVGKVTPLVTLFHPYLRGEHSEETRETLREIFRRPLDDQTLASLLECLNPKGPPHPPRSSRA